VVRHLLLVVVAHVVEDLGEAEARGVHVHGRVGSQDELRDGPSQRRRDDRAAELGGNVKSPPPGVEIGLVRVGEGRRDGDRARRRVEHRRVAVGVEQALGQLVLGEPGDLVQDLAGGVRVHLGVGTFAQDLLAVEDLEQVELEVADVALVVAH